ncbi:MAG TPA: flagellar motor protein MotB [Actinomycetes bacterium]|nr:flagellar motor protein MotB [Actinomycetes bacterium]
MSSTAPAARRHRRRTDDEEPDNSERWLVTYGDMLTLLMVLFIVLFAISQVDQRKFEELKSGLTEGFGAPHSVLAGSPGLLSDPPLGPEPLDLRGAAAPTVAARVAAPEPTSAASDAELKAAAVKEVESLEAIRHAIEKALAAQGLRDTVRFRYDDRGLVVSIVTDRVLFPADRATLAPIGQRVLDAIAPVLKALPNGVDVEGHTNTVPVKPKFFPTEWELSSARAVTVVRYLIDHSGIAAKRLTATGFADQHPLLPATDSRASTINRRVEVVIVSTLPAAERALIPRLAPPGDRL